MGRIIREKELLTIHELKFVRVKGLRLTNCNIELEPDVNSFLDFCISQGITTAFYKYTYYDRESYTVTNDLLKEQTEDGSEYAICKKWAEEYNKGTNSYDYDNPRSLTLLASFGPIVAVCKLENEWIEHKDAMDSLLEFQEEMENNPAYLNKIENGPSLLDEFRTTLLEDKEFRYCTNKSDRSNYLESFLEKKNNKKFLALAKGAKSEWERKERIIRIVNQIYNEYRNECHYQGIRVGEKL